MQQQSLLPCHSRLLHLGGPPAGIWRAGILDSKAWLPTLCNIRLQSHVTNVAPARTFGLQCTRIAR